MEIENATADTRLNYWEELYTTNGFEAVEAAISNYWHMSDSKIKLVANRINIIGNQLIPHSAN